MDQLNWVKLLKQMGVTPVANTLPTIATCPLCNRGQISLTADKCHGSVWFHCHSCKQSGDMISLAVARFKLSELQVISQFEQAGITKPKQNPQLFLARRRRTLITPHENVRDLVDIATRGGKVVINTNAAVTAEKIGLQIETGLSWAPDTIGKLIGWADADRIEDGFQTKHPFGKSAVRRSHDRRICPMSVDSAFIIPFYDLPGRVSTVMLLTPNSKSVWQFVEASVRYSNADGPYVSGGIFTHPDVIAKPAGSPVVLTDNVELAVRLHAKQFSKSPQALSLACYNDGHTATRDWQLLAGKDLIFWAPTMEPKVFAKAVSVDGKIVANRGDMHDTEDYTRNVTPQSAINALIKNAKSWQTCIEIIAERWDNDRILGWLAKANLQNDLLHKVLAAFPTNVRTKIKRALETDLPYRSLYTSKGKIEQRATGWYSVDDKHDELIIDAPFRLTQAITQESGRELHITYRGEAKFRNRVVPFSIDKETFHLKPLKVVHDAIVKAGLGVPSYSQKFESVMANAVLQFSSPDVVSGVSKFGYDQNTGDFVTPRGIFVSGTRHVKGVACEDDKVPLENVCTPFSRFLIRNAKRTWDKLHIAAARQLTLQMLSPVANGRMMNLLHVGQGAGMTIDEIVSWLGLDSVGQNTVSAVDSLFTRHTLPVHIGQNTRVTKSVMSEVFNHRTLACVAKTNHATMLYGSLTDSAMTLVSGAEDHYTSVSHECLWGLIKESAHDAMLMCNNGCRPTMAMLAKAVDTVFQKEFGVQEVNAALNEHVIGNFIETPSEKLARVGTWLVGVGRMSFVRFKGHSSRRRAIYKDVSNQLAYIPCVDLTHALKEAGAPHPTVSIDVPTRIVDSMSCWTVPLHMIDRTVHDIKSGSGSLRVFRA